MMVYVTAAKDHVFSQKLLQEGESKACVKDMFITFEAMGCALSLLHINTNIDTGVVLQAWSLMSATDF